LRVLVMWLLLAVVPAAQAQKPAEAAGTAKPQAEIRSDGNWWKQADNDAQDGMISGLVDCLHWEKHQNLPNLSRPDFILKVSRYYGQHPASITLDAALLALPKTAPPSQPGGEHYGEKHGYFDGMYWVEVSTEQREAFVLGYLFCKTGSAQAMGAIAHAVEKVDQWYESNPKKDDTKIADVLDKVGDLPHKAKENH